MNPGTTVICLASNVWVPLPMSAFISAVLPTAVNRPALTANASAFGARGIDRVDLGVEDNQIGVLPFGSRCGAWPCPADKSGDAGSGQVHEFSTAASVIHHRSSSPIFTPSQRAGA